MCDSIIIYYTSIDTNTYANLLDNHLHVYIYYLHKSSLVWLVSDCLPGDAIISKNNTTKG